MPRRTTVVQPCLGLKWVKSSKAQIEHKFSGLPPATDIRQRGWHVGSVPKRRSSAASRSHSITSSARPSSVGGTSRPSAFAVLRLITSSNFSGASTGSSLGFAPLKMRSA